MNEFYHVSRGDISGIKEFNLYKFDGFIEAKPFYDASEFKEYKKDIFPNGISKHGERYLHNAFKSTGPNLSFTQNEFIIETTLELIRRLKFTERKSRFVSWFACLSLEDAKRVKMSVFKNNGTIYKVSCNSFFKADMSLLRQAGSIIGIQIVAEKYWLGQASAVPFWEILMEPPITIIEKVE